MRGFLDLHSHWVAGIDDGAKTVDESLALLRALKSAGFDAVVATPHMRPGLFDNTKADLERAYATTRAALEGERGLPELHLASEHYFDALVYERLLRGDALPYPGGHAALVEFPARDFPRNVAQMFFELRRRKLRPVLAHPERYDPVWKDREVLSALVDGGTLLQLDVAALVGKYGRAPRKAAEALLDEGWYYLACSDAHAARDVDDVRRAIDELFARAGDEEARWLLSGGPRSILTGEIED